MSEEKVLPQENEENVQNEENVESVENAETVENVEGAENSEAIEETEAAENVESAENTEAVEETEAAENAENAEATEVNEDADKTEAVEKEEVVEKEVVVENKMRWYSLRVISGKEKKIKERIELEVERQGWKSFVTQVLVPSEKVYKIRNGKKVILERNILPGYILIEADPEKLKGEMVSAIANIPNVIHFLGKNEPIPMQQSEANRMLGKVDDTQDVSEAMLEPFIVGETVKIIDGPFNEFVGDIQEVNEEKKKLKVIVKIFGRGTEVELNFMQVEKQS